VSFVLSDFRHPTPNVGDVGRLAAAKLVLLEAATNSAQIHAEDGGSRLIIMFVGDHGLFYRVHTAVGGAEAIESEVPGAHTLDKGEFLGRLGGCFPFVQGSQYFFRGCSFLGQSGPTFKIIIFPGLTSL